MDKSYPTTVVSVLNRNYSVVISWLFKSFCFPMSTYSLLSCERGEVALSRSFAASSSFPHCSATQTWSSVSESPVHCLAIWTMTRLPSTSLPVKCLTASWASVEFWNSTKPAPFDLPYPSKSNLVLFTARFLPLKKPLRVLSVVSLFKLHT